MLRIQEGETVGLQKELDVLTHSTDKLGVCCTIHKDNERKGGRKRGKERESLQLFL